MVLRYTRRVRFEESLRSNIVSGDGGVGESKYSGDFFTY
jgi:hypothetical protein